MPKCLIHRTKAQLIKRLNDYITLNGINVGQVENEEQVEERSEEEEEFTDVQINTPPVEVEYYGDLVEEINKNGKRTRVLAHYTFTREFDLLVKKQNKLVNIKFLSKKLSNIESFWMEESTQEVHDESMKATLKIAIINFLSNQ
ncbi:hypothetical protein BpHYR1_010235 [Brachionus plicatilis]|uniref:Uncharacterized protein n=1 Tax=Brachionus plicatilis TaxID=10195 RepID=A0A3M7R1M6_BRAPC|nr:hypothetical protein BpHYR1_010235 [Brachionus plicatilis]